MQSQMELPQLVEIASHGEDVVITVDGKPKARLTKAEPIVLVALTAAELQVWTGELAALRAQLFTGRDLPTAEQLIDEDRADR